MVEIERFANGKNILPSVSIIDSKSIKNADTAKEKGYDAGKKVSGIKLHIAADTFLRNVCKCNRQGRSIADDFFEFGKFELCEKIYC